MEKFKPFVATHNSAFQKLPELFAAPCVAWSVLYSDWTRDCLNVKYLTEHVTGKDWTKDDTDPKKQALKFKEIALRLGATPEAIRLLGTLIPLTTKETKTMAEKLKAKGADAAALKAAAAKAPVAGKAAAAAKPKARGNSEALAKARAAQQINKKYKPLVKPKDLKLRGWTLHMVQTILANKDTDSAKAAQAATKGEFAGKNLDFSWAATKGYISKPTA